MDSVKWRLVFIYVFVSFLSISRGQMPTDRPSVNTTKGVVIGWYINSKASLTTYMRSFKGIPYAKPPVNKLRFMDPSAAEPWTEAKNLSQSDPMACPQAPVQGRAPVPYSEDCLYINVFTPPQAFNSTSLLPVMVFIYGGSFTFGSSSSSTHGPDYLVNQDIVYVSMNYRVGAFGFLNLGSDDVPGNAGLKDQLLALQWVQTEIRNFGGDPSKVTLFGESAGAVSVIMHYISPRTENLFSYAIAESGNALADWGFLDSGYLDRAKALSVSLKCPLVNDTVQISCLQSAKVDDIITNQNLSSNYSDRPTFVPSLEKPSVTAFLSDTPMNLFKSMLASSGMKRPLITGINKDEGVLQLIPSPNYYQQFYSQLQNYFIPATRGSALSEAEIESDVALIKSVYFNNTAPSVTNLSGYIKIFSDYLFSFSTTYFARNLANTNTVYLYQFDYNGGFKILSPVASALNITDAVSHGDELGYIFYRSFLNQTTAPENSTDKKTLNKMVKMWTNFAKTGNPTPEGTTDNVLENFIWTPISDEYYHYMRVTDQLNMSTDNFKEEEFIFWTKIEGISFGTKTSCSFALISAVFVTAMFF